MRFVGGRLLRSILHGLLGRSFMERPNVLAKLLLTGFILVPGLATGQRVSAAILFEQVVCDLGEVGVGTGNLCEFRFGNGHEGMLKITDVKAACGCTVVRLDEREYAAGESGVIKVTYTAGSTPGAAEKRVYVFSNDPDNPKVELTIKAQVVRLIEAAPQRLELLPRRPNAAIGPITLKSRCLRGSEGGPRAPGQVNSPARAVDRACGPAQGAGTRPMQDAGREDCAEGRKFSILGFESSDGAITADFDPNSSAAA